MGLGKRATEEANTTPDSKKPRKKPVTAKSMGLTKAEFDSVKAAPLKKKLKAYVKQLAEEVDADWHDGYEEQGETIEKWVNATAAPLSAVMDIGVKRKLALQQCHDLLRALTESYRDLCACPMRGSVEDTLSEFNITLEGQSDENAFRVQLGFVWVHLLNTSVSLIEEATLFQWIKDFTDATTEGKESILQCLEELELVVPSAGLKALLAREDDCKALKSTIRTFRMRRAIDRRFDGSPDRRTRHFSDEDEDS